MVVVEWGVVKEKLQIHNKNKETKTIMKSWHSYIINMQNTMFKRSSSIHMHTWCLLRSTKTNFLKSYEKK
jgi:hypothetical protein